MHGALQSTAWTSGLAGPPAGVVATLLTLLAKAGCAEHIDAQGCGLPCLPTKLLVGGAQGPQYAGHCRVFGQNTGRRPSRPTCSAGVVAGPLTPLAKAGCAEQMCPDAQGLAEHSQKA